jgi:hypothetical protein
VKQILRIAGNLIITLGFACLAFGGQSKAATIVAPISATASTTFSSQINNYSILNTINQSGLSVGYMSGVTDFNSYLDGNPTHTSLSNNNEWFSEFYASGNFVAQTVTYAFSALTSINGFALWNEEFAGIGTTQMLWSADGENYTFLNTINPEPSEFAPNNTVVPYSAQVFSFQSTAMMFFRLVIENCPGQPENPSSIRGCGIGEVAFSSVPPGSVPDSVVPVPAALPLLASVLGIFAWLGRRQKNRI